ncbi:unnamed protein product [Ilex paraguariensis]|uniref:Cyclin-dependent protein kinase inhibitor SMR6 n=1 Tax=Ilex paraguariensis TaxID=185542 RepID=A0ABC8SX37_9AQUA
MWSKSFYFVFFMGSSKKHQVEGGLESESKKWVIAGIALCAPLRSISTKPKESEEEEKEEAFSTTPTAKEAQIPQGLPCPPAPRKRRPTSTCHYNFSRVYFTPPDLESIFIERAN